MPTALSILLVEDHAELAETVGAYLEACGPEKRAGNGQVRLQQGRL